MGSSKLWLIVPAVLALAVAAALKSQVKPSTATGYKSPARYLTEEDAIRRGEQIGIGEATLEGPRAAMVNTDVQIKLSFRVGRAGMKTGGGIRIASAHGMGTEWGGLSLQTTNPNAENYLAFRTSTESALQWTRYSGYAKNPLFNRYHPWQNINEFKLAGPPLKPGDTIEILLGGKPGCRLQKYDETAFVLKFYVDPLGNDDYLLLARNPSIRILAGPAKVLHAIVPSQAVAGKPTWINVWAEDGYGNPSASYRGTIVFDAGDANGMPTEYTFRAEDRGAHRFSGVVFPRSGTYRIHVRERVGPLAADSNPLVARSKPQRSQIYWGDIHTHTKYSDGRGTPAETYDFAKRISALDFSAVTDHGFTVEDWMWEEIQKTAARYYQPGKFVTFLAYEWSGLTDVGGDHNVYTTESSMPLIRSYSYFDYQNLRMYHGPVQGANHVEELFRMLAKRFHNENLMTIPHYGGRHANPAFHNPELQRLIEIFSDHRRSEDWATKFLKNGYHLGIMASTDNHAGNAGFGIRRAKFTGGEDGEVFEKTSPAENGTALVAVYAQDLTREGIFQGLYHRHTYATTGTRIYLDFAVNGAPMGSEVRVSGPPRITASAEGTAPIKLFRVVKDGKVIYAVTPGGLSAHLEYEDISGDYNGKFYYIDLVQDDGKKAISSPVWVN